MTTNQMPKRDLILAIKPIHAARIFQGTKQFELRKRLPQYPIHRVFLYESGGGGIIGFFKPQEIISGPIDKLWEFAGERGASRERFYKYFEGRLIGFAIKIKNPLKFPRPIQLKELQRREPAFTAPMSFLSLSEDDALYKVLDRKATEASRQRMVTLVPITRAQRSRYVTTVTKIISARYDEITPQFAKAALRSHSRGADEHGIFTVRKEVLEIRDGKELIGFTTLTYKFGNSVKTGPTILIKKYQAHGFGQATRIAIEKHVRAQGYRKLYCTCPDNDFTVLRYLLAAGYRVEAHLRSHYKVENGEFVLGRLLNASLVKNAGRIFSSQLATVVEGSAIDNDRLATAVLDILQFGGFPIDDRIASGIVRNSRRARDVPYEDKPLQIVTLTVKKKILAIALCVPKRGGSVKLVLSSRTSDVRSLSALIDQVETDAKDAARRKVFALFSLEDVHLAKVLGSKGYEVEGVLREPYKPGVDCCIFSKFV
jgi:predicted transcriptional regulator/RimJ/RimL family protein N-acetyltransferase